MRVSIVCTETGGPMSFEVQDDTKSMAKNWNRTVKVDCPHCGVSHAVQFKELYIEGVLMGMKGDTERLRISPRAPSR